MAQLAKAILEHQGALAARARALTGDVSEASFLVGKVLLRAFGASDEHLAHDALADLLRRDLEALIARQGIN